MQLIILLLFFCFSSFAKNWADIVNYRGYTQFRYNRLFETNDQLKCEQCDKSLGENGGFFVRRARMIFFGEYNEQVFFYIQPDFASSAGKGQNYSQLRDIYFDIALSSDKSHRVRIGQSKVPYGFENLQSSSNRLALDRNDALNSAVANERDMGVFYYWASAYYRRVLARLTSSYHKGTGDYGIFGLGVYNGQTANRADENNNLHVVSRLTIPFEASSGRVYEASLQAYSGKYVSDLDSAGDKEEFLDQRLALSFISYPAPFGAQAEFNWGEGPEFDKRREIVRSRPLKGGYLQFMYNIEHSSDYYIPFIKYQYYEGGKKHEIGVPAYRVQEFEVGLEWQIGRNLELTAIYAHGIRSVYLKDDLSDEQGSRLRLQMQVNY